MTEQERAQAVIKNCQAQPSCDPSSISQTIQEKATGTTRQTTLQTSQAPTNTVEDLENIIDTLSTPIIITVGVIVIWGAAILLMLGGVLSGVNKTNKLLEEQTRENHSS